MKHLTPSARRFDRRIVDYWSYPVMIGVIVAVCASLALLFPPLEEYLTQTSVYRLLDRSEDYLLAAALIALVVLACVVPYWGGVICTIGAAIFRLVAYTVPFNLTAWGVYCAVIVTTLLSVRKRYRLSKWVIEQKEQRDGEDAR